MPGKLEGCPHDLPSDRQNQSCPREQANDGRQCQCPQHRYLRFCAVSFIVAGRSKPAAKSYLAVEDVRASAAPGMIDLTSDCPLGVGPNATAH